VEGVFQLRSERCGSAFWKALVNGVGDAWCAASNPACTAVGMAIDRSRSPLEV
jgi:hypothetical protein